MLIKLAKTGEFIGLLIKNAIGLLRNTYEFAGIDEGRYNRIAG
jgi:hypothetical protein